MCLCNKINKENDNYLDYYLIRDKYYELRKANTIIIKRSSTPYINPYTLEQMTSSDGYLDGYEPTKYSVVTDTRYEDPIVNIIPKEFFLLRENMYIMGKNIYLPLIQLMKHMLIMLIIMDDDCLINKYFYTGFNLMKPIEILVIPNTYNAKVTIVDGLDHDDGYYANIN